MSDLDDISAANVSDVIKISDDLVEFPVVFELVIDDHVPYVDPAAYKLKASDYSLQTIPSIKPVNYYITSGDAVEKTKVLDRDLWKLAGDLRKILIDVLSAYFKVDSKAAQRMLKEGIGKAAAHVTNFISYESAVWKSAGRSRKLLGLLTRARGRDIFLETEWDHNHRLLCVRKNPRAANQKE